MRHTTTLLAATCLLLAGATGCGGSSSDDKPAAKPTASKADRFLTAVHDAHFTSWKKKGPTDAELLDYPPKWCAGLAKGHSVKYLFSSGGAFLYPIGQDWGTYGTEANELMVAGVKVYCPEELAGVKAELQASGEY
jgi:hypothetical protein